MAEDTTSNADVGSYIVSVMLSDGDNLTVEEIKWVVLENESPLFYSLPQGGSFIVTETHKARVAHEY